MATARARKGASRPLSDAERRWLLDQLLERGTRTPAAADPAAGAGEASSVIVRPAAPEPTAAPAPGTAPERSTAVAVAGTAARPAAAPPRLADRDLPSAPPAPEPGVLIPQFPTRDAHRAAPAVDLTRYRAVFACMVQARDAPTEPSEFG